MLEVRGSNPGHSISKNTTSLPETKWLFGARCVGPILYCRPKKKDFLDTSSLQAHAGRSWLCRLKKGSFWPSPEHLVLTQWTRLILWNPPSIPTIAKTIWLLHLFLFYCFVSKTRFTALLYRMQQRCKSIKMLCNRYIVYIAFEGQRLQISIGDWAKDMEKSNLWPVKHIAIFYFARFDNGTLHLNNNHKSYFLQYSSFFTIWKGAKTCKRRAKGNKPFWRQIALGIVSKNPKVL